VATHVASVAHVCRVQKLFPLQGDWLRTTESEFRLLHCTEYQKTLYATRQLIGPVGAWWASFTVAQLTDHYMAWHEFHVAFRGHHLLAGIVRCKQDEFLQLCQGNRFVYEYTEEFNNVAQSRGHHVDIDAKKAELYHKGINI
jgi:hypothetical protein